MTSPVARPVPQPSELTAPFWASARESRLVRPYCQRCDLSFFTPQVVCPSCWQEDWAWQDSSGLGSVYSFTVVHRAPEPGFDVPYVLAVIDLDEGWSMLTNLLATDGQQPRIGQRVRVAWQRVTDDITLPVFEPVGTDEGGFS